MYELDTGGWSEIPTSRTDRYRRIFLEADDGRTSRYSSSFSGLCARF